MLYVQKTTTVAVPKVYILYTESCTGRNFIVMEYIVGSTLASAWPGLNAVQKSIITAKLRNVYNKLRQLPLPGYFGGLGRRPPLDESFWTRENVPSINGPFETEDEPNEDLAQIYIYDSRIHYKAMCYRRCLPHVYQGHRPTFTHGDFQRKNNMVCKVPPREGLIDADHFLEDEFEVTIIDWEKSGWYPSYWEYCVAVVALRWEDDW